MAGLDPFPHLIELPLILRLDSLPVATARRFDSVLCFGDSDWWYHNRGHADMQFMRRFARISRVVYVNSLGVRTPSPSDGPMFTRRIARKLRSVATFYRNGGEGFAVISPIFAPFSHGWAKSAARIALSLQLKGLLTALKMRRPLIWAACPTASVVLGSLPNQGIVYQLSDAYSALQGGRAALAGAMEEEIARRADIVVCSSRRLLERARRLYGKGDYVDHGVDFEMFEQAGRTPSIPPELENIKPPIIGFYGNMDANTVDHELLSQVVRLRPQYSFVLVGDMSSECEELKTLPNLTWFPKQPYRRVAEFGSAFNVCLMPWLQNEWIAHCNPVKLKEYLALGKPVVSTPFPELQRVGPLCVQAFGPEAFATGIDEALQCDCENARSRRREWASRHTWDAKFELVLSLLRDKGIEPDV